MNRNLYEVARQLKNPAVKTTASFNPSRLTKTLRNLVRKSIAQGIHSGGWSSKTKEVRKLVFALVDEKSPVYVSAHNNYISFISPRSLTPDAKAEIIGLLEADAALTKMRFEEKTGSYRPTRAEFNNNIDDRLRTNKSRLDDISKSNYSMIVPTKSIRDQIIAVFISQRTPEEVAIAERIATLLDKDEEILIPTSYNF
jgi:hypothetical protein